METVCKNYRPVLQILPYVRRRVGLVVTGSEVYEGLIDDESEKWVVSKLKSYGCELVQKRSGFG